MAAKRTYMWYPLAALVLTAAIVLGTAPAALRTEAAAGDPVLIIDAGHGGADGGAVAPDGTTEDGLNLDIARRLEALCAFWGVRTVMTRVSAQLDYPDGADTLAAKKRADQHSRVELIRSVPDGVLLSIHQNNYPAAAPWGAQVFYGAAPGSEELAALIQGNLTSQLCPENRRVAERIDDGVYLMKNAGCRAVLVECGFLSNPGDLEKLESERYRTQLAAVMLASYLQYTKEIAL